LASSIVRFASLEDVVIHKGIVPRAIERAKDIKLASSVAIHKVIVPRARDFDDIKSILLKNP
jgi:hypothetical protein